MVLVGSLISCAVYFVTEINIRNMVIKLFLTALFPVILFLFRFYEKAELNILLNPNKLFEFIKGLFVGTPKPEEPQTIDE
jgi:hypothetical protein